MKQNSWTYTNKKISAIQTISIAAIVSGLLDSAAASVVFYLKLGLNPAQVMQYVASALYGEAAFSEGAWMVIVGAVMHFLIAFVIAAVYFYLYPKINLLEKWPVISGLLLGVAIWMVMNLLIIPLSKIQPAPFELMAVIISISWHMLLVGLPISLIIKRHFENNRWLN